MVFGARMVICSGSYNDWLVGGGSLAGAVKQRVSIIRKLVPWVAVGGLVGGSGAAAVELAAASSKQQVEGSSQHQLYCRQTSASSSTSANF